MTEHIEKRKWVCYDEKQEKKMEVQYNEKIYLQCMWIHL